MKTELLERTESIAKKLSPDGEWQVYQPNIPMREELADFCRASLHEGTGFSFTLHANNGDIVVTGYCRSFVLQNEEQLSGVFKECSEGRGSDGKIKSFLVKNFGITGGNPVGDKFEADHPELFQY